MRQIRVYAPAKLNLYLDVLDKRPDGYHNIETLFEKIDLKDEIAIREKHRGIIVKTEPDIGIAGKDNLAYKAAKALCDEAGAKLNLEITIKKNIPVSAGLAGGSSDAASVIRALNDMFEFSMPRKALFSLASKIGKDVPFFMLDDAFCIGKSGGDALESVETKCALHHIIIKPTVGISTKLMYKNIDELKKRESKENLEKVLSALHKNDVRLLEKNCYNIFEEALGRYKKSIAHVKALFRKVGITQSFLSGSGSAVFCILKDERDAFRLARKIPAENKVEVFVARTYRGGIYGDN